ncbi:hypothetical protein T190_00605 [Sinorhizobium meliloti CCBAU 01290]|nr:hypothetical protein T190_00605 [Sinorhizobium meliloti CCBAU 01290]
MFRASLYPASFDAKLASTVKPHRHQQRWPDTRFFASFGRLTLLALAEDVVKSGAEMVAVPH